MGVNSRPNYSIGHNVIRRGTMAAHYVKTHPTFDEVSAQLFSHNASAPSLKARRDNDRLSSEPCLPGGEAPATLQRSLQTLSPL